MSLAIKLCGGRNHPGWVAAFVNSKALAGLLTGSTVLPRPGSSMPQPQRGATAHLRQTIFNLFHLMAHINYKNFVAHQKYFLPI